MVFLVMMVIKGMSYALLNPTKEILYQVLSQQTVTVVAGWLHYHHYHHHNAAVQFLLRHDVITTSCSCVLIVY